MFIYTFGLRQRLERSINIYIYIYMHNYNFECVRSHETSEAYVHNVLTCQFNRWWVARTLGGSDKQQGLIPSNFVKILKK